MNLDADTIRAVYAQLAGYEITAERAKELASELEPLSATMREVAQMLEFDDEPAGFMAFLENHE